MVKGISKRVIVVKAPVGSIFDEAIFLLREDNHESDIDAEKILREACAAADEYVRINCAPKKRFYLNPLWLICPAVLIALFLLIFLIL